MVALRPFGRAQRVRRGKEVEVCESDTESDSGSSGGDTSACKVSSSSDEEDCAEDVVQKRATTGVYVISAFSVCYHASVVVGADVLACFAGAYAGTGPALPVRTVPAPRLLK